MLKNYKITTPGSRNKSAFTLLEVIISIVILTIAAGSIYTLSVQTKKIIVKSEYSVTAMYLAQEGLEFVKNIRDSELSKSYNKVNQENGWGIFLKNLGYDDIEKGGYKLKKLNIKNNGIFELESAGVNNDLNFDKKISHLDDICTDFGEFKKCIYEHINIENLGNKGNDNFGKNFFRKIKIEKEIGELNLITVYSEIFWEEYGEIKTFVLKQKFGNILIN